MAVSIAHRLKELRKHLNKTQNEFCANISITQGAYSQLEGESTNISTETAISISNTYNVNLNWLLTGDGEMFHQTGNTADHKSNEAVNTYNSAKGQQSLLNDAAVMYVTEAAQAGFIQGLNKQQVMELPQFSLPGLEKGNYLAFNIEGDSMYSTLCNGDIVITKEVKTPQLARNGEIYILNTSEGLLVKRIQKQDTSFLINSDNSFYQQDSIDYKSLRGIYHVKRVISANLGPKNQKEIELLALYKEIKELKG